MNQPDPGSRPSRAGVDARIGDRVVVRHRLPTGGRTDTVGELISAGTELLVRTVRGDVAVPIDAVEVVKVVPPRPTRAARPHLALSIGDLERVSARHWVATEQQALGDWLLRASGGFTGRANSALVRGDPGLPIEDALDAVRAWYTARGLPVLASVAVPADSLHPVAGPPVDPGLLAHLTPMPHVDGDVQHRLRLALDRMGWVPGGGVSAFCLTAPIRALLAGHSRDRIGGLDLGGLDLGGLDLDGLDLDGLDLDTAGEPDDGWLATHRYHGNTVPDAARSLLLSAPDQAFFSIRTSGDPQTVAAARGSLAGGWGCITAVDVVPGYRRRGLARMLLTAVARWASDRGASSMFLQTPAANGPAQRLYLSAGFVVHHRYDYLTPAPEKG